MKIEENQQQIHKIILNQLKLAALALIVVILFGTLGYEIIEGWTFSDAAYMTIITIASVGYQEVNPLSQAGRLFTSILIFVGVAVISSWVAIATSFFVDTDLKNYFRRKKMLGKIQKMKNHTVVCGGGHTAEAVIEELLTHQAEIVLIENNPARIKRLEYKFPQIAIVESNAVSEETLWLVNIKAAKNLVTCLSCDVDNLYVVITARDLNANLFIIARTFDDDSTAHRILKAGANDVVAPNRIGGQRMAQMCFAKKI